MKNKKLVYGIIIGLAVICGGIGLYVWNKKDNFWDDKTTNDKSFLLASDVKVIGEYVAKMTPVDLAAFKVAYVGNKDEATQYALLKKYGYKG
ncbi:MAG: hypothetical protein WCT77_00240 [Bacteroidota bacterium]